jgi:hypothetical protein
MFGLSANMSQISEWFNSRLFFGSFGFAIVSPLKLGAFVIGRAFDFSTLRQGISSRKG